MTAMACCSHISILAGGSGCTVHRPTPTSSKGWLAKVKYFFFCLLISVLMPFIHSFSGRAPSAHVRGHRICNHHTSRGSVMPTVSGPVHQPVWRLHHEPGRSGQLPVLHIQDDRPLLAVQFPYLI